MLKKRSMRMKSKKLTAICLCAVLLGSMAFTACKKAEPASATADEVTVTSSAPATEATTEPQTEPTTQPQAETKPATTEAPKTEPATKAPSKQNSDSGNSGNTANKPDSSSNSNSGNNSGNSSDSAQNKPVTCIITVDGKDHKVNLDDTLTYTCYVKTPKKIENVQASLNYPGTTLELLDTVLVADQEDPSKISPEELQKVFPVLKSSVIYNAFNHNIIKFNASNISGMDFTKGDYLIKLRFKVISGINGAVSTKIEFMDEVGGKPYVDDFKISEQVEFKEELTK